MYRLQVYCLETISTFIYLPILFTHSNVISTLNFGVLIYCNSSLLYIYVCFSTSF